MANPLPTPTPPQPAPAKPLVTTPPSIPPVQPATSITPPPSPTPVSVPKPAPAPSLVSAPAPTAAPVFQPPKSAVPPKPVGAPVTAAPANTSVLSHMPPSRLTPGATRPISPITQPPAPNLSTSPVSVAPPKPGMSAAGTPTTMVPPNVPPSQTLTNGFKGPGVAAAPLTPTSPMPAARVSPQQPGATAPKAPTPPQKMAGVQKSPLRFLPIVLGILAIVAIIGVIAYKLLGLDNSTGPGSSLSGGNTGGATGPQTTLTYWGLWEPSAVLTSVISDYEQANPGIHIDYQQEQPQDYRERLQTAISQGTGPDIFRFHASWTPMLRDDLAPLPTTIYSTDSFASTFYPAAVDQLTLGGSIRGIPLEYDGLGLYYNTDILKTADAQPPKTWADLRILADKLTIRSGNTVQRSGLAIGNSTNVDHFSDILGLLMLQNGADLTNPTSDAAKQALIFYTDFITKEHVWSDTLPSSTVAFARGDAAMMLAPSWRAHDIIAQNPKLNFAIAPVPELGTSQLAWASFWAEGVNSKSKNQDASWKFLNYLSSADVMKKLNSQQAGVRRFGEIYSRKDLANDLASEPLVTPFLSDALVAKGWYMSSATHDNGINDQIIKYYQDAVTAVLAGKTPDEALQTVAQGVQQVLGQYGVPVTQVAAPTSSVTPANGLSGL